MAIRFFATTILLLTLVACGMHLEKRHFNKGFHVQFNPKKGSGISNAEKRNMDTSYLSTFENRPHLLPRELTSSDLSQHESTIHDFQPRQSPTIATKKHVRVTPTMLTNRTKTQAIPHPEKVKSLHSKKEHRESQDYWMYLTGGLFIAGSLGMYRATRSKGKHLTRWASKNKYASIGIIAALQSGIGLLGYGIGEQLQLLGHTLSESTQYVAAAVAGITLVATILHERFGNINLNLGSHYLQKTGQFLICAALLCAGMGVGNGLKADSAVASPIVLFADQHVKPDNAAESTQQPGDEEAKPKTKASGKTIALIIVYIFFAIVLAAGFAFLSCAALCAWGATGIFAIVGLACIYAIYHVLMIMAIRKSKEPGRIPQG